MAPTTGLKRPALLSRQWAMRSVGFERQANSPDFVDVQRHRGVAVAERWPPAEALIEIPAPEVIDEIPAGGRQLAIFEQRAHPGSSPQPIDRNLDPGEPIRREVDLVALLRAPHRLGR